MQSLFGIIFFIGIALATFGAYIQHFVTAINEEMWVLLVLGAVIFPVGVLHGWLVWFGVL
ncbi:MAG: hypothetical protein COB03_02185 [Alteromonas sp.]|nr:hypothetical protein [Halomonas sp.]PHS59672.1 MAG: hypothetical protein COB03_02185 [Alteromonas sp.]